MKVGILGFGTVASSTVKSFIKNQEIINSKTATYIEITNVATRTVSRTEGLLPSRCSVSNDCLSVVQNPEVDVVIELTGDVEYGKKMILMALENGKHVITANKALLALHGAEIFEIANKFNKHVLFEGAIAVSIPIVKVLKESTSANQLFSIAGVLNGTSNFILSKMSDENVSFSDALKIAQEKGFAEADPKLDINGEDAAHKIVLLATLAYGIPINYEAIKVVGIEDIEILDIEYANEIGYQIKLIAQANLIEGKIHISVQPTLVCQKLMLSKVSGSMNGIALRGDLMGDAFLYGSGAGGVETSSAILSDLLELANYGDIKNSSKPIYNLGFKDTDIAPMDYISNSEHFSSFYIRIRLEDKAGNLAKVSSIFASNNISIKQLHQNQSNEGVSDLYILTHPIRSHIIDNIMPKLYLLTVTDTKIVVLPTLI